MDSSFSKSKVIPSRLKVVSIFLFILSGLSIVEFISLTFTGGIESLATVFLFPFWVFIFLTTIPSLLAFLSVLSFFMGFFIWKGKNFARIFVIFFSLALSISSLVSIFFLDTVLAGIFYGGIPMAVWGALAIFLLFNKKVKEFFRG